MLRAQTLERFSQFPATIVANELGLVQRRTERHELLDHGAKAQMFAVDQGTVAVEKNTLDRHYLTLHKGLCDGIGQTTLPVQILLFN